MSERLAGHDALLIALVRLALSGPQGAMFSVALVDLACAEIPEADVPAILAIIGRAR